MDILGLKTHIIEQGQGPDVLVLHGWGASAKAVSPVVNQLARRYRVIAPDMPGFGESQEPPEAWGVSEYCAWVLELCRIMDINNPILVGHSFGGRLIIKLVGQQKITPPKIVLIDSAGVLPKKKLSTLLRIRTYKIGRTLFPAWGARMREKLGSADYKNASPLMRQVLVKVVNEDLTPYFSKNPYDTLLVWGENDTDTPLAHGRLMESLMPKSGLALIPGAGHFSYLDNPGLFARILDVYLFGGGGTR